MTKHPNKHTSGAGVYAKIRDTSQTLPRIDPTLVQNALGAEPSELTFGGTGSPLSLFQVRQELLERLRSTGGRPSLSSTSHRVKIPLNPKTWEELEEIASEIRSPDFSPSAGQIASVIINLSLRSFRKSRTMRTEST